MRFDYTGIITSAPDTGDPVAVFRLEIRIKVHGPNGTDTYRALVDTGADDTMFPASVSTPKEGVLRTGREPGAARSRAENAPRGR